MPPSMLFLIPKDNAMPASITGENVPWDTAGRFVAVSLDNEAK